MEKTDASLGPSTDRPGRLLVYAMAVIILAGVLLSYSNTLRVPFQLDDSYNILDNRTISSLWPPWRPFSPPLKTSLAGRPLANFTFALNYAISGEATWSYHLFNILIHALAALLLFGIVRQTLLSRRLQERFGRHATWIAFFSALLWAVHPLQTMAVTYITQRLESLMGCLFLASLYCAIRGWRRNAFWPWQAIAVCAFAAGTGVKEVIVVAPALIFLYDLAYVHPKPAQALESSSGLYAGLAVGLALLAAIVLTGGQEQSGPSECPPLAYLSTQAQVIVHYLSLVFWPKSLCFDYSWPIAGLSQTWGHVLFLGALAFLTAWAIWRRHPTGFAGAWFFLTLAPSSSIRPLPEVADEYRMYLPLAALTPLAVTTGYALLRRLAEKRPLRIARQDAWLVAGACAALILAGVLSALAYSRNSVYQSPLSLWTDTLAKRPQNPRAHNNLGQALADLGRWDEAVGRYEEALRLKMNFPKAEANLGAALGRLGKTSEAVAHLETALNQKPDLAEGHYNLAEVLVGMGQTSRALDQYQKAIASKPDFAWAHLNLGVALARAGKASEAEAHYRQAVAIDPKFVKAYFDLANILLETQRTAEAVSYYQTAVVLEPSFARGHANLGVALIKAGNPGQGMAHLQKAVELDPGLVEARFNLARGLAASGNWNQALEHFQKAAELSPGMAVAQAGYATALTRTGKLSEAATSFEKALAVEPAQAQWLYQLARIYQKQGRHADALARLEKAVSLSPKFYQVYNDLGLIYMGRNHLEKADLCFRKAMELAPASPAPYYNMACVQARQGLSDQAVAWLEKAAKAGFSNIGALEKDPDLAGIHNSEAFQDFIKKNSAGKAPAKDPLFDVS